MPEGATIASLQLIVGQGLLGTPICLFFGCGSVAGEGCGGFAAGDMISTSIDSRTVDSLSHVVIA